MSDVLTAFEVTYPGTEERLEQHGEAFVGNDVTFGRDSHGVWDLIRPERRGVVDEFATRYAAVRAAEARDLEPDAIRHLPELDPTHPLAAMWQQRASAYAGLLTALPDESPRTVLDIGAGCGWLAADFAQRGSRAAAVDITVDGGDGLALARHHDADLFLARAEMQSLPFASGTLDLAIFNASLHYAEQTSVALDEARRVVKPGGLIAVLDSPVFTDPAAGSKSVAEFAEFVRSSHRLEPADHAGNGFITQAELSDYEHATGLRWQRPRTQSKSREAFHKWRGARRAGREIAARPLLLLPIAPHGAAS